MKLTSRELATVLAALRVWQELYNAGEWSDESWDVATNGGIEKPLNAVEIDELCERLNLDD